MGLGAQSPGDLPTLPLFIAGETDTEEDQGLSYTSGSRETHDPGLPGLEKLNREP